MTEPAVYDAEAGTYSGGTRCPSTSDDGLPCQKQLYTARNGEVWDHSGGHMFATDETWAKVLGWHYDASDILAGVPTTMHPPEECPGPAECSTARYRRT